MTVVAILASSFLVGLSGAMMPGPLSALTIERSASWSARGGARSGLMAAVWVSTGHALSEVAMVAALVLGLGGVLSLDPVAGAIGIVGGLVLVYMGWGMASGAAGAEVAVAAGGSSAPGGRLAAMAGGAIVSVSNPYWLLWWATVGATYLALWAGGSAVLVAVFLVGHVASDYAWQLVLAGAVSFGGRWLTPRLYRGLLLALGVFLGCLGMYFAYSGARFLGLV